MSPSASILSSPGSLASVGGRRCRRRASLSDPWLKTTLARQEMSASTVLTTRAGIDIVSFLRAGRCGCVLVWCLVMIGISCDRRRVFVFIIIYVTVFNVVLLSLTCFQVFWLLGGVTVFGELVRLKYKTKRRVLAVTVVVSVSSSLFM